MVSFLKSFVYGKMLFWVSLSFKGLLLQLQSFSWPLLSSLSVTFSLLNSSIATCTNSHLSNSNSLFPYCTISVTLLTSSGLEEVHFLCLRGILFSQRKYLVSLLQSSSTCFPFKKCLYQHFKEYLAEGKVG